MKIKLILFGILAFTTSLFLSERSTATLFDKETTTGSFTAHVTEEVTSEKQSEPEILFYANSDHNEVGFVLDNISVYDSIEYEIAYSHETDSGMIDELITGQINNSSHLSSIIEEWILLGTESSGGTRVYHQGISGVNLSVDLLILGVVQDTLTDVLAF